MRRSPCMILVCLVILLVASVQHTRAQDKFINVVVTPDTTPINKSLVPPLAEPAAVSDLEPVIFKQAVSSRQGSVPRRGPNLSAKPIVKCKPQVCPPSGPCAPPALAPPCILPTRNCRQIEVSAQAFFARVRGKMSFPAGWYGLSHPEVDFNDGLGFPSWETLWEVSAWCQFRPNWAFYYSIMPIHLEADYTSPRFPGSVFKSKWDYVYQRVGIMYTPIRTCNAALSIYNSWVFNDEKLTTNNGSHCALNSATTWNRTRNMVQSGVDLKKCIRTMCNGGTLSCDSRAGISYLDGATGLDVQAALRYSVPMNCGRWGYVRGGYRYLSINEDRNDVNTETNLQGGFVELGLIF